MIIIFLFISVAPFVDVTALEIEVKGESIPLNVVLHPYAIHVPGKNLIGTTLKKMVTVRCYSVHCSHAIKFPLNVNNIDRNLVLVHSSHYNIGTPEPLYNTVH